MKIAPKKFSLDMDGIIEMNIWFEGLEYIQFDTKFVMNENQSILLYI